MNNQNNNKESFTAPNLSSLAPAHQGWLLLLGGGLLLAHTMGLLGKGINIVLIGLALYMIITGFVKARLHIPLQAVLNQYWNQHKK